MAGFADKLLGWKQYSDDRDLWRNIGWALASCNDERLRELYYLFSSKSNKFDGEKACDKIYDESKGNITIATLYKYAKDENILIKNEEETEYKEFNNYIKFFNNYCDIFIKNTDKFVQEMTKYLKYAQTRDIYIVKVGNNDYKFLKTSVFEKGISKYNYKKIVYEKGNKKVKKESILKLINDNIKYFTVCDIIFKPNEPEDSDILIYSEVLIFQR